VTASNDTATTPLVKYIYLDVVGFSNGRSAQAQAYIVANLNTIVLQAVQEVTTKSTLPSIWEGLAKSAVMGNIGSIEEVLYFPTGDGLCIALLNPLLPLDTPLTIALRILGKVLEHNMGREDNQRQFMVRIGINQNHDVLLRDINQRPNMAGAGINIAQRVMDFADASQILVSQSTYDILGYQEMYMEAFRPFRDTIKHGRVLNVYQYIGTDHPGLDTFVPTRWRPKAQPTIDRLLTLYEGHWFAYAQLHRRKFEELTRAEGSSMHSITILLHFLAQDAVDKAEAPPYSSSPKRTFGDNDVPLSERVAHYQNIATSDFWVLWDYSYMLSQSLGRVFS
jgi:hypothetical protein